MINIYQYAVVRSSTMRIDTPTQYLHTNDTAAHALPLRKISLLVPKSTRPVQGQTPDDRLQWGVLMH
jgi:hypothetical protein